MPGCPPDEPTLQRFIADIGALPPRPHHSALLERANRLMPDCRFRFALSRGGWYRPGGVLRRDGERLADDLEAWAEASLAECGGDLAECLERHADEGLLVTRHAGRTHYFVAPYGPAPADFLQLEVEETQEVLDRHLVDEERSPVDLPELLEPDRPCRVPAQAVDRPRYRFRRLLDVRQAVARLAPPTEGRQAIARFLDDWRRNPARGAFCEHWVMGVREHLDRWRNPVLSVKPVSLHAAKLRLYPWDSAESGLGLAGQVQSFDRACYPGGWYCHLVAGGLVPAEIAYAVAVDLDNGFGYLGDADAALLREWVAAPYSV